MQEGEREIETMREKDNKKKEIQIWKERWRLLDSSIDRDTQLGKVRKSEKDTDRQTDREKVKNREKNRS